MQPIHLGIGVVEGVVTALVVSFIYQARPEILESALQQRPLGDLPIKSLLATFLVATLLIGGVLSWFVSENPDGLEWSIAKITGTPELPESEHREHQQLVKLQNETAILPDYAIPAEEGVAASAAKERMGTSLSGILGGAMTLVVCSLIGVFLKRRSSAQRKEA
jgi:cobalt/nickel transport system permease protein